MNDVSSGAWVGPRVEPDRAQLLYCVGRTLVVLPSPAVFDPCCMLCDPRFFLRAGSSTRGHTTGAASSADAPRQLTGVRAQGILLLGICVCDFPLFLSSLCVFVFESARLLSMCQCVYVFCVVDGLVDRKREPYNSPASYYVT